VRSQPVVAYYRVSTRQQKRSGLGLMAQQDAVHRYVSTYPGKLLAELTEVESGRKSSRPKLKEALWLCRIYGAKLVIARLDRLARSVALIASLIESGVDFVAVDMPLASRFTIHILAAVAEYEAQLISERGRAALAAARARGRKFGNPDPRTHRFSAAARKAGIRAIREKARARALVSTPEQDCIVFRSKDASMAPTRMPSSTGLSRGRQIGVSWSLGVSALLRRERRLL
jgi:DNA invertase Pin-like site-specific DNA recombinase